MFDKRWGRGNDFTKQEVMSLFTQTARKFDPWKQNGVCWSCNLASRYRKVFHGIKHNDYENTAATKHSSYSVWFFRLICLQTGIIWQSFSVLTTRIEESYTQEINLIGYLQQLLHILNKLRCHFRWNMF